MDKKLLDQLQPEYVVNAIVEMARRWHQVDAVRRLHPNSFGAGRQVAYAQCIALLLGMDYGVVVRHLRDGAFKDEQ